MAPNPRQLILNLLLAADEGEVSARDAVASAALFGIRENSARVALARLAAGGLIEASGRGSYREQRVKEWKGGWVAVHVGALGRSDRVALRARDRALALLGLRELDRGFFVRPDNLAGGVAGVRERLHKLGVEEDAVVFLASEFDAAREGELEPEVAARESFLLGNDAIRQLVFDPLLPEPLVDSGERRAFVAAVQDFDRAGHEIWRRLWQGPATAAAAARKPVRTH
ncbi:MAG: PaaX domain protein C-domain [Moraxellaceae bacterium]|nr:PaaX domain protein C-domain [Moraxellaceae bacterium]